MVVEFAFSSVLRRLESAFLVAFSGSCSSPVDAYSDPVFCVDSNIRHTCLGGFSPFIYDVGYGKQTRLV